MRCRGFQICGHRTLDSSHLFNTNNTDIALCCDGFGVVAIQLMPYVCAFLNLSAPDHMFGSRVVIWLGARPESAAFRQRDDLPSPSWPRFLVEYAGLPGGEV